MNTVAAAGRDDCPTCHGWGLVCDDHPDRPWDSGDEGDCPCGSPIGRPCGCTVSGGAA